MNYALLLACALGATTVAAYTSTALLAAWPGWGRQRALARRSLLRRALPGTAAALLGFGLSLPAFIRYEPADTRAWPGVTALAFGIAGLLLVSDAMVRGLSSWRATVRLVREWGRRSQPLPLEGAPAPAFELRHPFPVVALVGIWRPRLFVATQVIDALTPAELQAVLAHEGGHLAARDNLKRQLLRFLPTLGWRRLAARLEERWEMAAELEADRGTGPESALDLASALLKLARLARPGARLGLPAATFHTGASVAGRVQALLEAPPAGAPPDTRRARVRIVLLLAALAALALNLLPAVHRVNEALIHLP